MNEVCGYFLTFGQKCLWENIHSLLDVSLKKCHAVCAIYIPSNPVMIDLMQPSFSNALINLTPITAQQWQMQCPWPSAASHPIQICGFGPSGSTTLQLPKGQLVEWNTSRTPYFKAKEKPLQSKCLVLMENEKKHQAFCASMQNIHLNCVGMVVDLSLPVSIAKM